MFPICFVNARKEVLFRLGRTSPWWVFRAHSLGESSASSSSPIVAPPKLCEPRIRCSESGCGYEVPLRTAVVQKTLFFFAAADAFFLLRRMRSWRGLPSFFRARSCCACFARAGSRMRIFRCFVSRCSGLTAVGWQVHMCAHIYIYIYSVAAA